MINFKVGIMGAGRIAGTIADTLNELDAFETYAIASRNAERAAAFSKEHQVKKFYGSYEELVQDPDVELIYIATPHSNHAELAKLCLNAGKPVLVEKAFSYDAKSTEEVLKLSEEKGIFCGEAMWIRFMPMYRLMTEYIQKGAIGHVTNITCSLGYYLLKDKRVTSPELAGGALLDLGVYPLNLISRFYGPDSPMVGSTCAKLDTGVDAQETLQFAYKGGRCANAFVTLMYQPDNNAKIYGDRGYIEIDNINCPETFRIYTSNHNLVLETKKPERQTTGYEFEFIAARDAIIQGRTECPEMPHSETLRIMQICDSLRQTWQIKFPME